MTRTEIIQKMADVVDEVMKSFQTDFTEYDKPRIESVESKHFPFLWIVSELHTHMISLGIYEEDFFNNLRMRYAYADGDDSISFYFEPRYFKNTDLVFLITEDNIRKIDVKQAKSAIKDYTIPAYEKWKALNGKIEPKRVKVKFDLLSLSKLRELIEDCRKHNDDSLWTILRNFHNRRIYSEDHSITVKYREWDNEFVWIEHYNGEDKIIGHIVFHGWPETGYMTNGSIQIDPRYGWGSHT